MTFLLFADDSSVFASCVSYEKLFQIINREVYATCKSVVQSNYMVSLNLNKASLSLFCSHRKINSRDTPQLLCGPETEKER